MTCTRQVASSEDIQNIEALANNSKAFKFTCIPIAHFLHQSLPL
jgi:hypothetical protein